jgi:hypothetical protein
MGQDLVKYLIEILSALQTLHCLVGVILETHYDTLDYHYFVLLGFSPHEFLEQDHEDGVNTPTDFWLIFKVLKHGYDQSDCSD